MGILESLNLPKVLIEKADRFLSALLGPAVDEAGQLVADKIRFRRYRNQVELLAKAEELLVKAGRKPRAVPLKTLVPLIEAASLEEEPSIQQMWSGLLASASSTGRDASLHIVCIHVLKSISAAEAQALQRLFFKFEKRKEEAQAEQPDRDWSRPRTVMLRISDLFKDTGAEKDDFVAMADNLIRLNLIEHSGSWVVTVRILVNLTHLGLNVLRECNFSSPSSEDSRT